MGKIVPIAEENRGHADHGGGWGRWIGRAGVLLMLALGGAATAASEDDPGQPLMIGVADVDQILRDSLAGKSVRSQAEKFDDKFQKQTAAEENSLRAAKQELDQHPQSEQGGLADKARAFEQSFADFQSRYTGRRRALEKSLNAAMGKVQQGMIEATQKVATARGVTLVLPGTQVLLASDKLNLTKDIIATMDKMLPRVDFPPPNVEAEVEQTGTTHKAPSFLDNRKKEP